MMKQKNVKMLRKMKMLKNKNVEKKMKMLKK